MALELRLKIALDGAPEAQAQAKRVVVAVDGIAQGAQAAGTGAAQGFGRTTESLASLTAQATGTARVLDTVASTSGSAAAGLAGTGSAARAAAGHIDGTGAATTSLTGRFRELVGVGVGTWLGSSVVQGALSAAAALYEASAKAQNLKTQLDFASGGNAASELAFIRGEAQRLGLELSSTAKAYAGFASAARGTSLEGAQARMIFSGLASAAAVLGLSADETSGALLAVQQMMSKGVVQAEELRGQLGERLPGAMQISARAMGVTTAELGKMLEAGMNADVFLPKLGRQFQIEFGAAAEAAAGRLDASVNIIENAWSRLKQNVGDSGPAKFMQGQISILSDGLNGVSESMELARRTGSGFAGQMLAGAGALASFLNPLNAVAYNAQSLDARIAEATTNVRGLQAQLDALTARGIRSIQIEIEAGVAMARLRELTEMKRALTGPEGPRDPRPAYQVQRADPYADAKSLDDARKLVKLRTDVVEEGKRKELEITKAYGKQIGIASTDPEQTAKLKSEMDARLGMVKTETARSLAAFDQAQAGGSSALRDSIEAQIQSVRNGEAIKQESYRQSTDTLKTQLKVREIDDDAFLQASVMNDLAALGAKRDALEAELALTKRKKDSQKEQAALTGQISLVEAQQRTRAITYANEMVVAQEAVETATLSAAVARDKADAALQQRVVDLQADVKAQRQSNEEIGLTGRALVNLQAARLDEQAAILDGIAIKKLDKDLDYAAYELRKAEAEQLRELARLKREGAGKQEAVDQAKAAADEWTKTTDQIQTSLTDALMRGFESGKDAAANLRDTIKNMFNTLVLRPIVQAVVTAGASALGLPGQAQASTGGSNPLGTLDSLASLFGGSGGGASGASSGGGSIMSSLGSLFGGSGAAGSTAGSSVSSFAQFFQTGSASVGANGVGTTFNAVGSLYNGGATSSAMGMGAGAAAGMAGGFMAGRSIGQGISGGYGLGGGSGNTAVNIGSAIGAIWGPIGSMVGGAIGGLVNRAFGRKAKEAVGDAYLGGTVSASDANLTSNQDWKQKGGWFVSDRKGTDKTDAGSAVDQAVSGALKGTFDQLQASALTLTGSASITDDMLSTLSVDFSKAGQRFAMTEEGMKKALEYTSDSVVQQLIPAMSSFRREGETLVQTTQRLTQVMGAVDDATTAMGGNLRALGTGIGSAAAKQALVDSFGSVDAFSQATNAYFQAFYSETEQAAGKTTLLREQFARLNIAMPTSRDQFRALVESLDLTTQAGRDQYAAMLQLSTAFDATMTSVDALQATVTELSQDILPQLTGSLDDVGTATASLDSFDAQLEQMRQTLIASTGDTLTNMDAQTTLQDLTVERYKAEMALAQALYDKAKSTLDAISSEREQIAQQIAAITGGPAVMTPEQIRAGINSVSIGAVPGNAAVVAAQAQVNSANALLQQWSNYKATTAPVEAATASAKAILDSANATSAGLYDQALRDQWNISTVDWGKGGPTRTSEIVNHTISYDDYKAAGNQVNADFANQASAPFSNVNMIAGWNALHADFAKYTAQQADVIAAMGKYNAAKSAEDQFKAANPAPSTTEAQATAQKLAAQTALEAAQASYYDALNEYVGDAGKGVEKLKTLREETLRYYQSQQALANLMTASADGLRRATEQARYNEMTPADQLASLNEQFDQAYAAALTATGEDLAKYGDTLSGLVGPLLDKAKEVVGADYVSLRDSVLAQADQIAAKLDALAPQDYEQQTLDLLNTLDTSLTSIEAATKSAQQYIVDAVDASRDAVVAGLKGVIAAVLGEPIPGFASGGLFAGGLRIVGENGPELEATGASRIWSASQTRDLLSGGGESTTQGGLSRRAMDDAQRQRSLLDDVSRRSADGVRQAERTTEAVTAVGEAVRGLGSSIERSQEVSTDRLGTALRDANLALMRGLSDLQRELAERMSRVEEATARQGRLVAETIESRRGRGIA